MCDGNGCVHCDNGQFRLTTCAKNYVDFELVRAINVATQCEKGFLPCAGGLIDQANWFVELKQALESEQNIIDAERIEKLYGR